jgi:hypothetical protein
MENEREAYKVSDGKPESKRISGRPSQREDNIKLDL